MGRGRLLCASVRRMTRSELSISEDPDDRRVSTKAFARGLRFKDGCAAHGDWRVK